MFVVAFYRLPQLVGKFDKLLNLRIVHDIFFLFDPLREISLLRAKF